MNKIYGFLLLICFLNFVNVYGQKQYNFEKQWTDIDTLLQKDNLPRTALDKVLQLEDHARELNARDEVIKALVYRLRIESTIKDNDINSEMGTINKAIEKAGDPVETSILKTLQAQNLINYFNSNRWTITQRKETVDYIKTDAATWSADDFESAIHQLFTAALANQHKLQATPNNAFGAVINKGNVHTLRPTIYDLVAHQALDYYKTDPLTRVKPSYAFILSQPVSLADVNDFIAFDFSTKDTLSHQFRAVQLFRQILQFHLNDKNPSALLDADIDRLEWCWQNFVGDNKDSLYLQSLQHISARYPDVPEALQAAYLRASYFFSAANNYQPYGDTTHRFDYVKAMGIIEENIHTKDTSEGLVNLLRLKSNIEQPSLDIKIEGVNIPELPMRALFSYKYMARIYIRIIKVNQDFVLNTSNNEHWQELVDDKNIVQQFQQQMPLNDDYQKHSAEIKINALPVGKYILLASADAHFSIDKKLSTVLFNVSNIAYISNDDDYFVLNRETGEPLKDVVIKITTQGKDKKDSIVKTIKTDSAGHFRKPVRQPAGYQRLEGYIFKGNDTLVFDGGYIYNSSAGNNTDEKEDTDFEKKSATISFFTDRSIYRPGQQVFFKAIAMTKDKETSERKLWLSKDTLLFYLNDANGSTIDSIKGALSDYASFSGSFNLPDKLLTGIFSIKEGDIDGNIDFNVEEYKRPTFYVDFDTLHSAYKLNDSITVTGFAKAYAGNNIDGANVKINITRNAEFPYPWLFRNGAYHPGASAVISNKNVLTDENGKFTVRFKASPDLSIDKKDEPVFNYVIFADVTDNNGETRSRQTDLSVGYKGLLISLKVPETIDSASLTNIPVTTQNLSGQNISTEVTVSIFPLRSPQRLIRARFWTRPDQFVMDRQTYLQNFPLDEYDNELDQTSWAKGEKIYNRTGNDSIGEAFDMKDKKLQAGWYYVTATAKDAEGNEVRDVKYMHVISNGAKEKYQFMYGDFENKAVNTGAVDTIHIGSSAKDVYVIQSLTKYNGFDGSKTVYSHFVLNEAQKTITYKTNSTDKFGTAFSFAFVKNNRFYSKIASVSARDTAKYLKIEYATFRDKTEPGEKEQWQIKIKNSKNKKADAELMSAMYDASLDALKMHTWVIPFYAQPDYRYTYNRWTAATEFNSVFGRGNFPQDKYYFYNNKVYDQFIFKNGIDGNPQIPGSRLLRKAAGAGVANGRNSMIVDYSFEQRTTMTGSSTIISGKELKDVPAANVIALLQGKVAGLNVQQPEEDIPLRTNFNETAFFLPQIHADKNGDFNIEFTMPDAVTTWKWMNLAYDKALNYGYSEKNIVSQKTLMVQPNMPRFLRAGDSMYLSAKISNLSEHTLSGNATIELVNPLNNEVIDDWDVRGNTAFSVASNQSVSVIFPLYIPAGYTAPVAITIKASAGNFSDGEMHTLPVLSDRMLVTESLPLFMKENGTKTFSFDKLKDYHSNTLENHSLTVEYTSNPVWYAVQSLPYLMEYPYECAEQTFNRFYADALGTYVVANNPSIEKTFKLWLMDTAALESGLSKNPELKQVLLQETPWVMDAQGEAAQKRDMAKLFDTNALNVQLQSSLNKLQQMQMESGGFAWFNGGRENRYITQYILSGIGKLLQLKALAGTDATQLTAIAGKASDYLSVLLKNDYQRLNEQKADLNKDNLSPIQIQYLYARSFFAEKPDTSKAYQYYISQEKRYWNKQSAYMKAMIATTFYRAGDKDFAVNTVVRSLIENAVNDNEKGMYWKDMKNGYYWYESPIEQQALIIGLLGEIAREDHQASLKSDIAAMQHWLIINKQTKHWGTTKATADAVYALLSSNGVQPETDRKVLIKIGSQTIQPSAEEAGTGYFKTVINGDEVKSAMGNITVTTSDGPATVPSYGAVYWQYFEGMEKISAAKTNLSIHKKLFIEKNTAAGKKLVAVNDGDAVNVGDKLVVRIEMKTDRDMDFVHLKDMRAATMEPDNVLSTYKWQDGLGYYEATQDASTNFFFDHLPKGSYVFDYPVHITNTGTFSSGIATIECMYAPEFSGHSEGFVIHVNKK